MGVATAAGFVAGIVYLLVTPLVQASFGLFIIKEIVLSAIISALFAWIYFQDKTTVRSVRNGLFLGLLMLAIPFAEGLLIEPATMSALPFEQYTGFILLVDTVAILIGTGAVGHYLAKQK